ncbi:type IV pilin [Halobaculum sp. EA56]|uniref:type IV pilin n=1 Tax=Halobaculum sp. EA56 TaxID=3421648 RepID=UPI003EBE3364
MDPTTPAVPADERATAASVGVALLVLATVALSAAVGAAALAASPASPPPTAAVDLAVEDGTLTFTHRGGDALDVRDLRVVVRVDGDPLRFQPPVPFFAARGFESGPTGPFNAASDPGWSAGETASLGVAGTNSPRLRSGALVEVSIYGRDHRIATLRAVGG